MNLKSMRVALLLGGALLAGPAWASDLSVDNLTVATNLTVGGTITGNGLGLTNVQGSAITGGGLDAGQITAGQLSPNQLPSSGIWNASGLVVSNAQYYGSGAGLTGLTVSQINGLSTTNYSYSTNTTTSYITNTPASGLIAYWPLNGDLLDHSGNGIYLVCNGTESYCATLVPGQTQWLSFDGNTTLNTTNAVAMLAPLLTNAFSIVKWFTYSGSDNSAGPGFYNFGSICSTMYMLGTERLTDYYYDGSRYLYLPLYYNDVTSAGTTNCVVDTVDANGVGILYVNGVAILTNTMSLFVNGAVVPTNTISGSNNWINGLTEGVIGSCYGWNIIGAMGGIKIYNRALSANEVSSLWNGNGGGNSISTNAVTTYATNAVQSLFASNFIAGNISATNLSVHGVISGNGAGLVNLNASQIIGQLTPTVLPSAGGTWNAGGLVVSNVVLQGNGAELTNISGSAVSGLDASQIISGQLSTSVLPTGAVWDTVGLVVSNVALYGNGAGLTNISGSAISNLDASQITSGQFSPNQLPSSGTWNAGGMVLTNVVISTPAFATAAQGLLAATALQPNGNAGNLILSIQTNCTFLTNTWIQIAGAGEAALNGYYDPNTWQQANGSGNKIAQAAIASGYGTIYGLVRGSDGSIAYCSDLTIYGQWSQSSSMNVTGTGAAPPPTVSSVTVVTTNSCVYSTNTLTSVMANAVVSSADGSVSNLSVAGILNVNGILGISDTATINIGVISNLTVTGQAVLQYVPPQGDIGMGIFTNQAPVTANDD